MREIERDRQRKRERERGRQRQRETERETGREREGERGRETEGETERDRERQRKRIVICLDSLNIKVLSFHFPSPQYLLQALGSPVHLQTPLRSQTPHHPSYIETLRAGLQVK